MSSLVYSFGAAMAAVETFHFHYNLNEFRARGWNTFDVRSLAAVVHMPTGLAVRVGLARPDGEVHRREFRWPDLVRLGPHMPDCSYAAVTLQTPECRLHVEFAADGNCLAVRAATTNNRDHLRPCAEVCFLSGFEGQITGEAGEVQARAANRAFRISCPTGRLPAQQLFPWTARFVAEAGKDLLLWGSDGIGTRYYLISRRPLPNDPEEFLDEQKQMAERWERRFEDADLQDGLEGLWRSVIWNTIYAPSIGAPVTVVSRDWCVDGNYGDFVLFEWDTFFAALQAALRSNSLAYANVMAVLSGVTDRGFVPSIYCQLGRSEDRSMLPVGSMIVLKLYERFREKQFLEAVFPTLMRWHDWWMGARDGNGDGLLEWGSDPIPPRHPQWQAHTLQAARYESGLDNSPLYDDAEFDTSTNTMRVIDVGLNSAYAMDAWALARIAEELGRPEDAGRLAAEHRRMSSLINERLWSEWDGIYLNRRWDGTFVRRLAPTLFYPMIARVAPPSRAARMVREHLMNRSEFWGEHVIPSIARSDPAFVEQAYWRGRIWGPMNWLVHEGLLAYGFIDEARELAQKSLKTFLAEWRDESHVHENYNAITGDGDDVLYSEPVYCWGGLLALTSLWSRRRLSWKFIY